MVDGTFLTARIDGCAGPAPPADHPCVPWWSFTKTALAVAALKLVGKGLCNLDAPLGDQPFTLRQLLQHRAGVPNYGGLAEYHEAVRRGDKPWDVRVLLERVGANHLDFQPGTGWRYSNVGYLYVRQLIEATAGRDLGSVLRELVFGNLGLTSVRLATQTDDMAGTAWGNAAGYDPGWVYHGLLLGTPGDAARFLHGLLSGAILPPDLLSEMTTRHPIGEQSLPGRPWQTTGYGLGMKIGRMAHVGWAIGHSGVGPGSVCAVYHFRDRPTPCTIAAFTAGEDEGRAEHAAVRLARSA